MEGIVSDCWPEVGAILVIARNAINAMHRGRPRGIAPTVAMHCIAAIADVAVP